MQTPGERWPRTLSAFLLLVLPSTQGGIRAYRKRRFRIRRRVKVRGDREAAEGIAYKEEHPRRQQAKTQDRALMKTGYGKGATLSHRASTPGDGCICRARLCSAILRNDG
ncbi:hypothetical protein LY76DRAFT_173347 [Colletotrichum caudatum]|nr:hypothetical protein LY76DRAFT_173347 [Colletotrichum caudatum]